MTRVVSRVKQVISDLANRVRLQESYVSTFEEPDGQEVLRHLAKTFHVGTTTFVAGDPHMTSYREGQRSVVIAICRYINKDPTELIRQIEAQASQTNEQ